MFEQARAYFLERHIAWPIAAEVRIRPEDSKQLAQSLYGQYRMAGFPSYAIIDKRGVIRFVGGDGASLRIGPRTTFNQVGMTSHEGGAITFGADCMLSTDIHMDASDMHPIYDRATGERLNPPRDIEVGDHVWLGARVLLLKGAKIGSGTIVGAGSMVAGTLPENVLAAGSPAKVVRENVAWTREFEGPPEPQRAEPAPAGRGWPWRKG